MFPRFTNPHIRAAFWAAVLTLAASSVACPVLRRGGDILDGAGPLFIASLAVLMPGMLMTGAGAWIGSQFGNSDVANHNAVALLWLSAPILSWLFYFGLLSLIARMRKSKHN